MSKLAEYGAISKAYDNCRSAVASHIYVGYFLTSLKKPLKDISLLDAGCGTGNYAAAMLDAGIGSVSLLDANTGMLEKAKDKLKPYTSCVEFKQSCLPILPYPNETFDAVVINNVIHHLDSGPDFPNVRKTMEEAYRVLQPGGLLVIQHAFTRQHTDALWFEYLAPDAMVAIHKRIIDRPELSQILHDVGYQDVEILVPTTTLVFNPDVYFNEDGPLDPLFRQADSFWGTLSSEQLAEAQERVKEMKENGTMKAFIAEKDKTREDVGQISLIFAKKM